MEYKRFSTGFVLAAFLVTNAHVALAEDLPPPPPPPPGTNSKPLPPPVTTGSGTLDAPPPPPPGVNIEPYANVPPTKPPTSTPDPAPTSSTLKPWELAPPPTPPPGVDVVLPKPKPARIKPAVNPREPITGNHTVPAYRPQEKPQQSTTVGWYGWKSMIGLVPVYGFFVGGIALQEGTLLLPAVLGGMFVTPIAHWTHGNRGTGWLSFGLNIGAMIAGGAAGGAEGAAIGLGIWNVIDIAALHHVRKPETIPAARASILQSMAIVPMMDHGRKGLTIMGHF